MLSKPPHAQEVPVLQSVGEEHGKGPQPSKIGKIRYFFCSLSLGQPLEVDLKSKHFCQNL